MTISVSEKDKNGLHMINFHLQIPHIHLHHHDHHQKKNHHHHHHHHHEEPKGIPKGCLAVMVGSQGEEQQRFVIPVIYINHPLFMQLLKEAEEEYGFDQKGPITIPCHVEEFRTVQGIIDKENSLHHPDHHHHGHNHHHHHIWCFRVWSHHRE